MVLSPWQMTTACNLDASHLIDEAVQCILQQDPCNIGAEQSYQVSSFRLLSLFLLYFFSLFFLFLNIL